MTAAPAASSRRRELTRHYRQAPPPMGVYAIRLADDPSRLYLGASLNVDGAMNRDRFELRFGGHRNARLSQDAARGGVECLRFDLIDTVKPRDDDPAFDAKSELAALLALWADELGRDGTQVDVLGAR